MRIYNLYDAYDGKEVLVKTGSFDEVVKAIAERNKDTDGKFEPVLCVSYVWTEDLEQ